MNPGKNCVLTINGGSSSIKFALYEIKASPLQIFYGEMESIGTERAKLSFTDSATSQKNHVAIKAGDSNAGAEILADWLEKQDGFASIKAVGHRIVYGMKYTEPQQVSPSLLNDLKAMSAYDPEHLPGEIELIEIFQKRFPALTQVVCFDTSFHAAMPVIAKLLPIPRRYYAKGIQRYGFHGLSYAYLLENLKKTAGDEAAKGKIIMAHLGNGASLAAVKDGRSMDTSMGFTPTSGLLMGTRTGDLDPGVAWYLMQEEKMNAEQFSNLINHESGLSGISETSADMRELLKSMDTDSRAADAVELFCYQTKKWIGSFAAVLGGLDTLVFSGGIGENAPEIRSRICSGLQFLGIELNESSNKLNELRISADDGKVSVRVIKTDEQLMIAKLVCNELNYPDMAGV